MGNLFEKCYSASTSLFGTALLCSCSGGHPAKPLFVLMEWYSEGYRYITRTNIAHASKSPSSMLIINYLMRLNIHVATVRSVYSTKITNHPYAKERSTLEVSAPYKYLGSQLYIYCFCTEVGYFVEWALRIKPE
jgi:hypothetical protein